MLLFFDTETTGIYRWKSSHTDPAQPHLVQLGAVLHDENRQVRGAINLLIKPAGWEIPAEASAIHGITTELATKYGVPLGVALGMFASLAQLAEKVVAHNTKFDAPVMASQFYRIGQENPLTGKYLFCTMMESTNICKVPSPRGYGYKWPTLDEAHRHFTGEGFDNAHDAMADVLACARVYYHLTDALVKGGAA